jgi:hypothetical protein
MRFGTVIEFDADIDPIAGDKSAGGRHNHGLWRFVQIGQREQDAKRVAFEEVAEAGCAIAAGKPDFGTAPNGSVA